MAVNGILTFGLVNVPVGVDPVVSEKEVSFKTLHATCRTPLKQQKFCPECGEIVTDEPLKGYEYAKGSFVTFTPEEIASVQSPRSKVVVIDKFILDAEHKIEVAWIDRTYVLRQNELLQEPYLLLRDALLNVKATGIGHTNLWGKDHPCAIWADGVFLFMSLLHVWDDVRDDVPRPVQVETLAGNQELAEQLVRAGVADLVPAEDLTSASRGRLKAAISARMAGEEIQQQEEPEPEVTTDIQERLRLSIELATAR